MFEIANSELMSQDTQSSLKMLYERTFEPEVARKVLKLVKEADKNFRRIMGEMPEKTDSEREAILLKSSKMACDKLSESDILHNYPISAKFINGLQPFIN